MGEEAMEAVIQSEHVLRRFLCLLKFTLTLYHERDRHKPRAVYHSENLRILDEYWEDVYTRKRQRKMIAPEAAKGDLTRAVEAAGNIPLDSCKQDELQDHIDDLYGRDHTKQRRTCTWLNMILKWLERPFILEHANRPKKIVRYLNQDELIQIQPHLNYHGG